MTVDVVFGSWSKRLSCFSLYLKSLLIKYVTDCCVFLTLVCFSLGLACFLEVGDMTQILFLNCIDCVDLI